MTQENGRVSNVEENGWAQVVTKRSSACGDCSSKHSCVSFGNNSKMVVRAQNDAGAGVGDLVSISLGKTTIIKGALVSYMIPIILLLAGAIVGGPLGKELGLSESGGAMFFGLAGLILGFGLTRLISRSMERNNQLTPVITKVIERDLS